MQLWVGSMSTSVDEVLVFPVLRLIETESDRLVGCSTRMGVSTVQFKVLRMRFYKPEHGGVTSRFG